MPYLVIGKRVSYKSRLAECDVLSWEKQSLCSELLADYNAADAQAETIQTELLHDQELNAAAKAKHRSHEELSKLKANLEKLGITMS